MLYGEAVSFEKVIGLVTILVTLTLLACGAFYFRRRIWNLECALKDQAKVTQNVLQMMSTIMPRANEPEASMNAMSSIFDTFAGEHHVIAMGGWMPDISRNIEDKYDKVVDVTDDGKESSELIVVSDVEDDNDQECKVEEEITANEVSVKQIVKEYIHEHTKDDTKNMNYDKMKVDELRDLIEKRGLPPPGKNKLKKELIQILEA